MKSMLEQELEEIKEAIKTLPTAKQRVVIDAYKELAFQWCQTNAFACFTEEVIRQIMTEEQYRDYTRFIVLNATPYTTQKMLDTYPWYDEGFEEEEDEAD